MDFTLFFNSTLTGEFLLTFAVSMLPIAELRAAIPLGVSLGLSPGMAMLAGICGNLVPVPFIILFIRKIFDSIKSRSSRLTGFIDRLESKAEGKWDKVHKWQFFGLALLVAIPLPGTGAWTGSLIAALMDMRLKNAFPAILLGVIIAAIIMTVLTYGVSFFFA